MARPERESVQQETGQREVSRVLAEPLLHGIREPGAEAGGIGAREEFR